MSGSHVLVCRVCLCFAAVLDIWGPCFGLPCLVSGVFCSRAGSFYTWHFTLHTLHFILHTPYLTLYARHSAFYTSSHSTLHTGAAALCVPMRHSFSYPGVAPHHPNPSLCWCFHVFGGPGGKKDAKIIRCFWRLIFGRVWAMFWRFFAAPWKQKHHKIPCVCPFCM